MGYNHRIATQEIDTQLTIPVQGTAGLQVAIGIAPINLAEDPEAVTNVPVIAYDFAEAERKLGYSDDFVQYTLCQVMDASFRIFSVAPVVFINVLDAKKHKKVYTKENIAVINRKASIGDTGILIKTLKVKGQNDSVLSADVDYIAGFNKAGGIEITFLTTDNTASINEIKVEGDQIDPSMVTEEDIIGGYDAATGKETGLEVIRQVYPKLGFTPGIILAPGWSQNATVAAVMCAKTEDINGSFTCETAIDIDTNTVKLYTALKEAKEEMAITNKHAVLLWPKLRAGKKEYAYSAVWAAMTAFNDAQNNDVPMKSPSNKLVNMSAAILEDGTEVMLDTTMAEIVNSYGIVTAINDNGWRSWGNNTAAYPTTTDPKDRWISCRRMMSWYRNHFILTYKAKVDDPTNYRLIDAIVDAENLYLNSLTATGDIAGGIISFNEEENPIESILNGAIVFYTKIAFWTPAEYILNKIEFDPTILQNALGGE